MKKTIEIVHKNDKPTEKLFEPNKLTLVYFDLYGRAEPIRMALWKAGIQYEDKRLSEDKFKMFQKHGQLPFGTLPILQLQDGTQMV